VEKGAWPVGGSRGLDTLLNLHENHASTLGERKNARVAKKIKETSRWRPNVQKTRKGYGAPRGNNRKQEEYIKRGMREKRTGECSFNT